MTVDTRHLVFIKMWFEDDVVITAAAACVILSIKSKKLKKRFWVRPSLLTRKQYSGSDLMIDLQRDDINLSGELRYAIVPFYIYILNYVHRYNLFY